jgi:predicted acylesterase/phospholipase RssA
MSDAVTQAKALLAAPAQMDAADIRDVVTRLKREFEFGLARKLLERTRARQPGDAWITQQLALCTYKDEELHPASRYRTALNLLETIGLRSPDNKDIETLSLGGAVHKRLWEHDGQLEHLYESLACYRAAHERNPGQSQGYAGVNAAYICDLLATRAETIGRRTGTESREAQSFRQQARDMREQVRAQLAQALSQDGSRAQDYWFVVTLAEAEFGLGNYAEAGRWLEKAGALPVGEWERQTTVRQLVSLARHQGIDPPPEGSAPSSWAEPWRALHRMLGDETAPALGCYRGKVGLALSGGGFRASFFHLGVMARLAEVDALRGVDVISSVSGGSILAAHYYLELQRLLETKADRAITRQDYIDLVLRVQERFLAGVQRNIRWLVFDDFIDNVRMLFTKRYSRSRKLGEQYESQLYSRVEDGKQNGPRSMPQLLVSPQQASGGQGTDFHPKFQNWRRRAKVPVLLLNTTSLNSGHNWFFTASWMGEPPGLVGEEIDVNERYRRLHYSQAPEDRQDLKNFRLGHAVAASSCVPGLFEPLVIDELYPQRTVRLVDGGVHDNQGMQGLLDEGCTLILCSDASGQMADVSDPCDDPAGVMLRANSILQDRVREAEYQDVKGRLDSRALEGLMFVHAKKELESRPLDWVHCKDPETEVPSDDKCTSYGVDKELQARIAALRTDLDAFTEVEAYSLMASGYLMTRRELLKLQAQHDKDGQPGTWGGFDVQEPSQTPWPFLPLQGVLAQPPGASSQRDDLGLQLTVGRERFLKAWKLVPELRRRGIMAVGIVAVTLIALIAAQWHNLLFSVTVGGFIMMILALLAGLVMPTLKWLNPSEEARSSAIKVAIALTGYVMAKVHLNLIDPLFLARGKVERLLGGH